MTEAEVAPEEVDSATLALLKELNEAGLANEGSDTGGSDTGGSDTGGSDDNGEVAEEEE